MDKESARAQRNKHWNTVLIPPDQATLPPIIVPRGADDSHPQLLNSAATYKRPSEKKRILTERKQASDRKQKSSRLHPSCYATVSRLGYLICNVPGCKREYVNYHNFIKHFMNKHSGRDVMHVPS